jgi:hypothetical protein
MKNASLDQLLEEIHATLENADQLDEKGKQLLRQLAAEITQHVGETPPGAPAPSLLSALDESIAHLQVEHPALTRALSQFVTSLSNAGI